MLPFALTIFTGAFLLFLVQPLIGKYILPWFGGTPGVWTTCMLFFQLVLLGGYAYAHFLSRWLKPRGQAVVHLALLLVSLAVLPIIPAEAWKPKPGDAPITHILLLLGATIGLPYFVVSTTGPLMQSWFSHLNPGKSPYRLYALSNIGSLLALLAYPFLIEPRLPRQLQALSWGWGLIAYVAFAAWCVWLVWKRGVAEEIPASGVAKEEEPAEAPSLRQKFLWLALPACASALLLATTNKLTQDVAVIPFLWILPLSLYLLTFILCFSDASPLGFQRPLMASVAIAGAGVLLVPYLIDLDRTGSETLKELLRWMNIHDEKSPNRLVPFFCAVAFVSWHGYWRPIFLPAMLGCFAWLLCVLSDINNVRIAWQVAAFCMTMFTACMVCHGELYAQKPHPRRLTGYYLMISLGGAVGGFLVAVVAPHVFHTYAELAWSCAACAVLVWLVCLPNFRVPDFQWWRFHAWMAGSLVAMAVCLAFYIQSKERDNVVEATRNFYGAMSVLEYGADTPGSRYLLLQHGRITHGFQLTDPDQRRRITSYYGEQSGVALAIRNFPRPQKRIGVVGLGTGTTAAFGEKGDYVRIYEINSEVLRIATNHFTFIKDTRALGGTVDVIMGDARLSMESEEAQRFDVLALDAFSSDAIPVHLLTKEAVAIYGKHLAPDGVLAIHISNRYLDLEPVVENVAKEFGYQRLSISDGEGEKDWWIYSSTWVLLSKNKDLMTLIASRTETAKSEPSTKTVPLWTDDYASLLPIMSW